MSTEVASLHATISADTTKIEAGLKGVKDRLKETKQEVNRFSGDFIAGLNRGNATAKDFGGMLERVRRVQLQNHGVVAEFKLLNG